MYTGNRKIYKSIWVFRLKQGFSVVATVCSMSLDGTKEKGVAFDGTTEKRSDLFTYVYGLT